MMNRENSGALLKKDSVLKQKNPATPGDKRISSVISPVNCRILKRYFQDISVAINLKIDGTIPLYHGISDVLKQITTNL